MNIDNIHKWVTKMWDERKLSFRFSKKDEDELVALFEQCASKAYRVSEVNTVLDCQTALLILLDQIDYTAGNCRPNEMIGAILPANVLALCQEAAQRPRAEDSVLPIGPCPFCQRGEAHPKEFCYYEIRRTAKA